MADFVLQRTLSRYFDVSHVTAKLHPSNISKVNKNKIELNMPSYCDLLSNTLHLASPLSELRDVGILKKKLVGFDFSTIKNTSASCREGT